jgi:hypothetical protein
VSPIAGSAAFALVADLPVSRRPRQRPRTDCGRAFCSVLVIRNVRDIGSSVRADLASLDSYLLAFASGSERQVIQVRGREACYWDTTWTDRPPSIEVCGGGGATIRERVRLTALAIGWCCGLRRVHFV